RGANRGSFLWGRSVHNVRIERLWVDVTKDFGGKWKQIFIHMETWLGLDIQLDEHMWLLHQLFLRDINADAELWRQSWNFHSMRTPERSMTCPNGMWLMGMIELGYRGLTDDVLWNRAAEEGGGYMYGVDWQSLQDDALMEHHRGSNP
ncbi:hypothetical protein CALCODRAFT_414903, partial [Calocera cornea HHB12733]